MQTRFLYRLLFGRFLLARAREIKTARAHARAKAKLMEAYVNAKSHAEARRLLFAIMTMM